MRVTIRPPDEIDWLVIGDVTPVDVASRLDPGELASHMAFHERGGPDAPQLLELRLQAGAFVVPHRHEASEILYVVAGELHWGERVLGPGASIFIEGGATYGFRAGPTGLRLLNFRPVADPTFHQNRELSRPPVPPPAPSR